MKLKIGSVIIVAVVLFIILGAAYLITRPRATPPDTAIHYHPQIHISLCGKSMDLPKNTGTAALHTHEDIPVLHLEGAKAQLGDYFKIILVTFNDTCFGTYCNGNICPSSGEAGTLAVYVNGTETSLGRNYALRDGDDVLIEFK